MIASTPKTRICSQKPSHDQKARSALSGVCRRPSISRTFYCICMQWRCPSPCERRQGGTGRDRFRWSGLLLRASSGLDQSLRRAQVAARPVQDLCGFAETATFEQQERSLDVAFCPVERIVHFLAAATGELQQDVFAAPEQLLVDGFEVD